MVLLDTNKTTEFNIVGRGRVLSINQRDYTEKECAQFEVGKKVVYFGKEFRIVGIELGISTKIGLVVESW